MGLHLRREQRLYLFQLHLDRPRTPLSHQLTTGGSLGRISAPAARQAGGEPLSGGAWMGSLRALWAGSNEAHVGGSKAILVADAGRGLAGAKIQNIYTNALLLSWASSQHADFQRQGSSVF